VLLAVAKGKLPARGAVVGAEEHAVCEDCEREKQEKRITRFHRPWEIIQDPAKCLMDQGILCVGSATRSGCGVRCPNTGQGCRGCYGPLPGIIDHAAKIMCAISSIIDSKEPEEIQRILAEVPDIESTILRFGMPATLVQRSVAP
jgi:F420-non-reducing hydrogenase small subunit